MSKPTPFSELWAPTLAQARSLVAAALAPEHPAWALWPGMAEHLEGRCLAHGGQVLLRAFRRHQAQIDPSAWLLGPPEPGEGHYRSFLADWAQGGQAACFAAHPLLAGALAGLAKQSAEAFLAWVGQWEADLGRLVELGLAPSDGAWPSAVAWGLSDPHGGGRSVSIASWPDGQRLVHKPRDGGMEAAWQGLLAWVRARDERWDLPSLPLLSRGDRLWMACVAPAPCVDDAAVGRFYGRVGALMALLHLLWGNDCHHENLIAAGEWPVVVDAESFLLPDYRLHPKAQPQHPAWATRHALAHGVLLSGLLPRPSESEGATWQGEGLLPAPEGPHRAWRWLDANSNRMRLEAVEAPTPSWPNLPRLGGVPQGPEGHLDALLAGFEGRWHWIESQAEALAAADGPLEAFRGVWGRFVLRPSRVYAQLLRRLSQAECWSGSAAQEAALAGLGRAFEGLPAEAQPAAEGLLAAERRALLRGDLPCFGLRSDRGPLWADGQALPGWVGPGFGRMQARLASWNGVALAAEVDAIRVALQAPAPPNVPALQRRRSGGFRERAGALVAQLKGRAVRAADGGVTWAQPRGGPEGRHLHPQGPGLYHGRLGTAIALAAWAALEGDAEAGDLASRATEAAWRDGVAPGAWGLGSGLGGWLYGLATVGGLLGQAHWVERAIATAEGLRPEAIAAAEELEVVSGLAGLALGLSALPQLGPHGQKALVAVMEVLLARQGQAGCWGEGAARSGGLGFAHGASGQAWALAQASHHVPPGLAQAARQGAWRGWAMESQAALPPGQGWPDGRNSAAGPHVQAWCHGAVGVGLARAGALAQAEALGLDASQREALGGDLRLALLALEGAPPTGGDTLCCGEAGRVALLLAARKPTEAQARAEALAWAPEAEGWRHLSPNGAFCPSFFQGAAGVAYLCLRLAHPQALPEALLVQGVGAH